MSGDPPLYDSYDVKKEDPLGKIVEPERARAALVRHEFGFV